MLLLVLMNFFILSTYSFKTSWFILEIFFKPSIWLANNCSNSANLTLIVSILVKMFLTINDDWLFEISKMFSN